MKQEGDNNTANKLTMEKPSCKMNLRAMVKVAETLQALKTELLLKNIINLII